MAVPKEAKREPSAAAAAPVSVRAARKASPNTAGASAPGASTGTRRSPGPQRPVPSLSRTRPTAAANGPDTSAYASTTSSSTGRGSGGGSTAAGTSATTGRTQPMPRAARRARAVYRYLVLPGNESVLLREALMRRPWWEPVPEDAAAAAAGMGRSSGGGAGGSGSGGERWNLWAGLNGQRFNHFELLQAGGYATAGASAPDSTAAAASRSRLVNRLPEHRVICTKSGLAGVLAAIQAATAPTLTTVATATTANSSPGGATSPQSTDPDIRGTPPSPASAPSRPEPGPPVSNAGSGSGSSAQDTSWIPETYVVPAGPKGLSAGGAALAQFKAALAAHAAAGRRLWIAKPTSLNRGNGIEVFDSLERILEHIKSRPAGSSLILQKYIERPLLLAGRKFDIRAYVLVGPDGAVWFHKEAYCRTSSTPYDSSDLGNRSAHLTNDAVQKHLDTYNAFEDHCKLSLEELGPALRRSASASAGGASAPPSSPSPVLDLDTTPGREAGLWGAMRRCVEVLFSAAAPLLNPRRLAHCFELLGLDFMLDVEGRVYLIEVNTSPALFRAGAYLSDLLPRLVEEVVQKVVDPLFPPPPSSPPTTTVTTPPYEQADGATADGTEADGATALAAAVVAAGAPPGVTPLDGFVRVEMDERLGAAVAAQMGRAGKGDGVRAAAGDGARAAPGSGVGSGSGSGTGRRTVAAGRIVSGPGAASGALFGARVSIEAAATAPSPMRRALRLSDRR